MTLSRFERKLLVALVAVAVMPMLGALFLGQAALSEAYEVGVNDRVRGQLEGGLSLYREHFLSLRKNAENIAEAVSNDHALRVALGDADPRGITVRLQALCDLYPSLVALTLRGSDGEVVAEAGNPQQDPEHFRLLQLSRQVQDVQLRLTLTAPTKLFVAHQKAGELAEVFERLAEGRDQVSNYYLLVYMGFLLAVIALAVTVGIVLSRRVTRRIAELAEATARVGAGDLEVQVPTGGQDEIGELTQAFNDMVRDIRESRDRIEFLQRLGAWQEFARRLAHEIKNPLTPIQLAVQEIHRSYGGEDTRYQQRLDDTVSIVEEEVATLRRLVSEFSDFARMPEAQLEDSSLRDFLAETCVVLNAIADEYLDPQGEPLAVVDCQVPEEPLPVRIDAMMLRRVLDNLIRNAVQAVRETGRPGHVQVRAQRVRNWALLEVSDDGPGVSEALRARVFDPYVTSKSDGTGLGLAITKKVVIEHNGEVTCGVSDLGGARFTIRLPLQR